MSSEWWRKAACHGRNPEYWFPKVGRSSSWPAKEAVAVCKQCPVRPQCADYAAKSGYETGIWAGVNLGERGGAPTSEKKRAALLAIAAGVA
ncbi:WhiB family transcriptional regulator [Nocardia otitidiscaviarum]|uniref:WhiB family transcriptional regulator n=1 Tax=Nocardia otitidiscaviarum TaxID=1823 RepID=UPI0005B9BA32|nr:WhiB family transcriptional regulator [Nocardia otitidiscaviarum]